MGKRMRSRVYAAWRVLRSAERRPARRTLEACGALTYGLGERAVLTLTGLTVLPRVADSERPVFTVDAEARLLFAHYQWRRMVAADGHVIAYRWFHTANPWLGYDVPLHAIRNGRFGDVADAVTEWIVPA
jgi:hypothetical protein